MHADEMEDISRADAGDIVALFGVDCFSGDTFTDGTLNYTMTSIFVPEPVISLTVSPKDNKSANNMAKALNRFVREDPTFRSWVDKESGQTIVSGMGELHLEIYVEKNEKGILGQRWIQVFLEVAYRETISRRVEF